MSDRKTIGPATLFLSRINTAEPGWLLKQNRSIFSLLYSVSVSTSVCRVLTNVVFIFRLPDVTE